MPHHSWRHPGPCPPRVQIFFSLVLHSYFARAYDRYVHGGYEATWLWSNLELGCTTLCCLRLNKQEPSDLIHKHARFEYWVKNWMWHTVVACHIWVKIWSKVDTCFEGGFPQVDSMCGHQGCWGYSFTRAEVLCFEHPHHGLVNPGVSIVNPTICGKHW